MANVKNKLVNIRDKNYLLKEFNDYRQELLNYARAYFPNKINDFSESSLGGMLLDFAAITGDALSYYMDHQFGELDPSLVTETENITRHIRRAGITAVPPSPSSVDILLYIEVDVEIDSSEPTGLKPNEDQLIKIGKNSVFSTGNINFTLMEDVDFSEKEYEDFIISERNDDNVPVKAIISKKGFCVSGNITTETFDFGTEFLQFPTINLTETGITEILSVLDSDNNNYYQVEFLSQDTVFLKGEKSSGDNVVNLEVKHASRRFIKEDDFETGLSTIRFGSNNGQELEDDLLKDPSDASLPLYGRSYFNKFSIDPANLLKTDTLGIAPRNTTISVNYMHGGGISHNVGPDSITEIALLNVSGPENATQALVDSIIDTLSVTNVEEAVGGTNGFDIQQLKDLIPTHMKMQNRIVNHEDILARIYTIPSPFGRIHRAAVRKNNLSILSKYLHVVCKNSEGFLVNANSAIKNNISNYLNEMRLIGDVFEIVDTKITNIQFVLNISVGVGEDIETIKARVANNLILNMRLDTYQIDQPILLSDIQSIVLSTQGVRSLNTLPENIVQIATSDDTGDFTRTYSDIMLNLKENLVNGVLYPPEGGIFELKYGQFDIKVIV